MQIAELKAGNAYILCICEGTAEEEIINLLLDNDKLIFTREDLIDCKLIRTRKAEKIQEDYLNFAFEKPLVILRVLDSKSEGFKLGKAYQERYKDRIINIITSPEIEILMIIHKGDYSKYTNKRKSKMKPSEFCKIEYGLPGIKRGGMVREFFGGVDALVNSINEYARVTKTEGYTLKDLIEGE